MGDTVQSARNTFFGDKSWIYGQNHGGASNPNAFKGNQAECTLRSTVCLIKPFLEKTQWVSATDPQGHTVEGHTDMTALTLSSETSGVKATHIMNVNADGKLSDSGAGDVIEHEGYQGQSFIAVTRAVGVSAPIDVQSVVTQSTSKLFKAANDRCYFICA